MLLDLAPLRSLFITIINYNDFVITLLEGGIHQTGDHSFD